MSAIKRELITVGIFLGAVWAVFLLDSVLPLDRLALVPRRLSGLAGIPAMPFLHADLRHILSNTVPLAVLLALLVGSRAMTWQIVTSIILGSGCLLWVAGNSQIEYVGASMLVFGLIGYLVTTGFLEKRPIPLVISIVVGLMYGGTFVMGLVPLSKETSELAHFFGAVTGVGLAFLLSRVADPPAGTGRLEDSRPS